MAFDPNGGPDLSWLSSGLQHIFGGGGGNPTPGSFGPSLPSGPQLPYTSYPGGASPTTPTGGDSSGGGWLQSLLSGIGNLPWGQILQGAGNAASIFGDIYGAKNQADINAQNLAARQQQFDTIKNLIGGQMQPGSNPYSSAIMQFLGGSAPGYGQSGQGGGVVPGSGTMGPVAQGTPQGVPGNPYMFSSSVPQMAAGPGQGAFTPQFPQMSMSPLGPQMAMNPMGFGPMPEAGGAIPPGPPQMTSSGFQWGIGQIQGPFDTNPGGQLPQNTQQFSMQGPASPAGLGGGMYRYQPTGPFTYNPTLAGGAPMVGAQQIQNPGVTGYTAQLPSLFQAPQANVQPSVQAQQINGIPQINPLMVSPTGTQGLNTGQDALMQMMRSNLQPANNPDLNFNLQQLGYGNSQYDQSGLFNALDQKAQQGLDQQIAQLQGSAGSFGQRLGTGMLNAEGRLRETALTDLNAQKQNLGFQSFEAAQGRRQPALNTMADLMGQANQVGLANQGNQLQAASQLGNLGLQQGSQNLQAQLANQDAALRAQQANQNASLGVATANQGAGLQAGLANQSLAAQMALANQNAGLQAGLAGQSLLGQLGQFNAGQMQSASQLNAQLGLQAGSMNQDAALRAALANQGLLGQYGMANANIMNQAGQFNAQMGQSANQFNAGQGNIYNNLIMQALSQAANLQQGQQGQNASLLGILAGVGVPQAQPSPWASAIGNIGTQIAMMPFLNQAYQQNAPQQSSTNSGAFAFLNGLMG